jgi:hypothetical protein
MKNNRTACLNNFLEVKYHTAAEIRYPNPIPLFQQEVARRIGERLNGIINSLHDCSATEINHPKLTAPFQQEKAR